MAPNHIRENANAGQWYDHRWQITNSIRTIEQIRDMFPGITTDKARLAGIENYEKGFRFQITPYMLNYLGMRKDGTSENPLASLFFPDPNILLVDGKSAYTVDQMNWEMPKEFPIPGSTAFQLKYDDRLLLRSPGCMAICSYCFEAHRVLDKSSPKKPKKTDWKLGVEFLRSRPGIREFVFSGGDPLLAPDCLLEKRLADLRSIPHIETVRFNSAVFMHCPMRITEKLVEIFKRYDVTEIGVHIVHPSQITPEFVEALNRFDEGGYGSLMKLAQIPLLRGINDSTEILHELLCKLERLRVKAYYLLHGLPWTLGGAHFRTSVYKGVESLRPLYRRMSHVAWPEYVIVARGGKATVPLERNKFWLERDAVVGKSVWTIDDTRQSLERFAIEQKGNLLKFDGTPEFMYATYKGNPVVVFLNWKGDWEMYLDA